MSDKKLTLVPEESETKKLEKILKATQIQTNRASDIASDREQQIKQFLDKLKSREPEDFDFKLRQLKKLNEKIQNLEIELEHLPERYFGNPKADQLSDQIEKLRDQERVIENEINPILHEREKGIRSIEAKNRVRLRRENQRFDNLRNMIEENTKGSPLDKKVDIPKLLQIQKQKQLKTITDQIRDIKEYLDVQDIDVDMELDSSVERDWPELPRMFRGQVDKLKNLMDKQAEIEKTIESAPPKLKLVPRSDFNGKSSKFPSVGKVLGVAGAASDIADITSGDIAEGVLGLGSNVLGRAAPYSGILRPEKTVSEELESRQMQEAKERMESEDEAKYKREALRRLMSKMEE